MPRQKHHRNRVYQVVGEPGPGSVAVGYVRYSSELQDPYSIVTQKRRITEYAEKKGWKIVKWYEEPEQSAKYEDAEKRPVFAELLNDAGIRFQVVLCYMNNRWSRNVPVAFTSLTRLRGLRVWWATADGLWDIDKVQQDGFNVAFAVDTQMNAGYVVQLSKRTIDGKEDRARDGYHNGSVPFGYLPPEYPKAPDGAPSTWRPPRMPVRPDPINFPALVRIGELAAQGWSDADIADDLEGYISRTARFGERMLTKDTIAAIRRSWFPREFAPGSGHGHIETPSGELVEGRHQAAWPFDLWQLMAEVKDGQYHRPSQGVQHQPREFSRIIVCAACRRPLRVANGNNAPYYRDTSEERKLPCAATGRIWIKSETVLNQFGSLLRSIKLPAAWREAVAERSIESTSQNSGVERVRRRRAELEAEQKRLVSVFTKGYMTEHDLDEQMEHIRRELFTLPVPVVRDTEEVVRSAITAGETLTDMADYWGEANREERRDIVWSLLVLEGLVYDLERRTIVGLLPRSGVLPVLALGLEGTGQWYQHEGMLLLQPEYLPITQVQRDNPHLPPPQQPSMTPEQQQEAIAFVLNGMSLRQVAKHFGTSRESVRRVMMKAGVSSPNHVVELTPEQEQEIRMLLGQGLSLRRVAKMFGVSHDVIWRIKKESEKEG